MSVRGKEGRWVSRYLDNLDGVFYGERKEDLIESILESKVLTKNMMKFVERVDIYDSYNINVKIDAKSLVYY